MNLKRITSTILSVTLISTMSTPYAADDVANQNNNPTAIRNFQNNEQQRNRTSHNLSILRDPVCLAILAGGAIWLGYSIYQTTSNGTRVSGSDVPLPGEFRHFDWGFFCYTCGFYNRHIEEYDFSPRVRNFYRDHIAPYMNGDTLDRHNFQLHVLNDRISRRRLEDWSNGVMLAHVASPHERTDIAGDFNFHDFIQLLERINNSGNLDREPHDNDPAVPAVWHGYNWQRFNDLFKKCHQLVICGHRNDLPEDAIRYYNTLKDFLCNYHGRQIIQMSDNELAHAMSQNSIEKADLDNWLGTVELLLSNIPSEHFISHEDIQTGNRFISNLNEINFGSESARLTYRTNRSFLSCNRPSGWHSTALEPTDTEVSVMKRRIDNIFGTESIRSLKEADLRETQNISEDAILEHLNSTPDVSFRNYVFGPCRFYGNSRYEHLKQPGPDSDPEKLVLFARYLKAFENATADQQRELRTLGLGIIKDSGDMCGNELSQIIDNLSMSMDTVLPDTTPTANAQQLIEKAITTAKRHSLKITSNSAVERFCNAGVWTAEYQKNLFSKLAPIFGINDSKPFIEESYGGTHFMRWVNNEHCPEFRYLCDTFFSNCIDGISENVLELLSGLNEEQIANLKEEMLRTEITYSDFKKLISSSTVSNRINLNKDKWLNMESNERERNEIRQKLETKNFDQRFDDFVNEIFDDEDKVKLQNWKNHPTTVAIPFDDVVGCVATYYQNYVPELSQYNGKKPDLWFADILTPVYLHNNGSGLLVISR